MFEFMSTGVEDLVSWINSLSPAYGFFWYRHHVIAILATLLVSLMCGAVGSLVVGQRLAFFSDALAHCAFAGVACGLLVRLILGATGPEFVEWIFVIMVVFGVVVGLLMVFVQETSGLPSDTVIGVFFAGAIGLGAIFMKTVGSRSVIHLENFLFGDPLGVTEANLVLLFFLMLLTWAILMLSYNTLVFSSFNRSLALSRRMAVRWQKFVFVALLGLIVNVCLNIIGVLLVNGLLIVPAATAANGARNMRQLFWASIALCLLASWGGIWLWWNVQVTDPIDPSRALQFGLGGIIIVLAVLLFIVSLWLGPLFRDRKRAAA